MLCVICHSITFCRHFTCNKGVDTKDREKLENKWSDFVRLKVNIFVKTLLE